ncbi:NUDIX domain-containing protein [Acuticoccus sp. MNP-M23]|uniref:NUDIX domain-containing protein n=1 Tax=Acuticoccus sp. MNP-M23 TaxID=3072793 RepID=UPI002815CE5A|nr:NUDIX domain-containing protein [Acuticoccus sp. MNP-M23]WMS42629.1 NUDIX domain-containing protein [Acuticoccus sp. MNP-M23]
MADPRGKIIWRLRALVRPPVTLGVRIMVIDAADRIVLVRHTYTAGWHCPGGGVDPHESAREAAERELWEETGLRLDGPAEFFGFYFNKALEGRDHVALFVRRLPYQLAPDMLRAEAGEIAEVNLFPVGSLPQGAGASLNRRLAEVLDGAPRTELW